MLTYAVVFLCVAQMLFFGKHWMRVTARDREAVRVRRMRESLDWRRPGHRSRIAGGAPQRGEARGR